MIGTFQVKCRKVLILSELVNLIRNSGKRVGISWCVDVDRCAIIYAHTFLVKVTFILRNNYLCSPWWFAWFNNPFLQEFINFFLNKFSIFFAKASGFTCNRFNTFLYVQEQWLWLNIGLQKVAVRFFAVLIIIIFAIIDNKRWFNSVELNCDWFVKPLEV